MLKIILSAACASALLAGTALAEQASHPSKLDRPSAKSAQTGAVHSRAGAGAAAGASSQSLAPECRDMASEEETTRCLNRHMAQMVERGDGAPKR